MCKKGIIIFTGVLLLMCCPVVSLGETYKVLAMKNCAPTFQGKKLVAEMTVSDPKLIKENWTEAKGSKYIKLEAQSDKSICVLTPTKQKASAKKKSDSGAAVLWDSFVSQKKCSTRAPENELFGGLADNLSRTFYVLMPQPLQDEPALKFASNLPSGSSLRCSYLINGQSYTFDAPMVNGAFVINYSSLPVPAPEAERTILKLSVDYIAPDGRATPLSSSMILILIPE